MRFVITLIIIIVLTLSGVFWTKSKIEKARISQTEKMRTARIKYEKGIKDATILANELLQELERMPVKKLPPEYREVFSKVDFSKIMAEVDINKMDMNINFNFFTNEKHTQASILTDIDYDVGEYRVAPNAAFIVFKVLEKAINQTLTNLITGYEISTKIKGIADGIPIKQKIYRGSETILNENFFNVNTNNWEYITLIPNQSPRTNKSIAFLRAYHVREFIKYIDFLKNSPIELHVEEVENIGTRKSVIQVNMEVKEIFREGYEQLGLFEKAAFHIYDNKDKIKITPAYSD